MTEDDRMDLAKLIASQCNAIQQDIMNRALSGRTFSDVAMNDAKRILSHLVQSIKERE